MAGQGGALAFSKAFDCCDSEHEESQLMVATRATRHGPGSAGPGSQSPRARCGRE